MCWLINESKNIDIFLRFLKILIFRWIAWPFVLLMFLFHIVSTKHVFQCSNTNQFQFFLVDLWLKKCWTFLNIYKFQILWTYLRLFLVLFLFVFLCSSFSGGNQVDGLPPVTSTGHWFPQISSFFRKYWFLWIPTLCEIDNSDKTPWHWHVLITSHMIIRIFHTPNLTQVRHKCSKLFQKCWHFFDRC